MSTFRVFNILMIGAKDAGKSTFINALANYLTYETLDEALDANEPVCVIPSTFEIVLANFKKIKITQSETNKTDMMNVNNGQQNLCAQEPRVYSFFNDEVEFNIINILGIEDFLNAKNKKIIFDKLKEFSEIHRIFLIFDATMSQITPEHKYNLNETLMLFQNYIKNNINFVITNARGYDYNPGHLYKMLAGYVTDLKEKKEIKIELNENTVFCVDNESYKFQCGWNKSEEYRKEMKLVKQNYIDSWDYSRRIILKLLGKISALNGHNVNLRKSIDRAQTMIHCAIGPLAMIAAVIQRAVTPASRQANIDALMKSGNQIKIEIDKTLPRTVCTSKNCIEAIPIPGTNKYNFNFKTVCHEECFLRNVPLVKFPEPALEDCQAFDLYGICFHCGCRVERHMHLSQKQIQKQSLQKVAPKPLTRKEAEAFMDIFVAAHKNEQVAIMKAIVKLSLYLKQNAFLEYNNAFEERINLEIRKEQAAFFEGVEDSAEVITKLQYTLQHYKDQMKAINVSVANGNAAKVTEEELKEIMTSLFTLQHNGANIRKLYEAEIMCCRSGQKKISIIIKKRIHVYTSLVADSKNIFPFPKNIINENENVSAVGVDLGTSRCCVAVNRRKGIEAIPLDNNEDRLLPSYVGYDEIHTKCGQIVIDRLRYYSQATVFDSKRIIGKNMVVIDKIWSFKVIHENNQPIIMLNTERGEIHQTATQVAAVLLKYMKEKTEQFQGKKLSKVVITVPAAFNSAQEEATKEAARLAGWESITLLPEPIAASFAYFIDRPIPNNSTLLLFDLGGGTLDVCVFRIIDDKIQIVSKNGDFKLGGRDFDSLLMDYFSNKLKIDYKISNLGDKKYKLLLECQKIKHNLSVRNDDQLDVEDIDPTKTGLIKVTEQYFNDLAVRLEFSTKNQSFQNKIQLQIKCFFLLRDCAGPMSATLKNKNKFWTKKR